MYFYSYIYISIHAFCILVKYTRVYIYTHVYTHIFDSLYSTCYIYIVLHIGVTLYYFLLPFQTRELEPFFGSHEMQGSAPPTFDDGIDWGSFHSVEICVVGFKQL